MKNELSQSEWVRVDYKGWKNAYRFQTTGMVMTVVGDIGARIMEYGFPGHNIFWQDPAFFGATLQEKGMFLPGGSQFDLLDEHGPVSPKEPALWTGEYNVDIKAPTILTATSQVGTNTGLQIIRDIEINPLTGEAVIKQTVYNKSVQKQKIAIWDRTWTRGPCLLAVPVEPTPNWPEGYGFLSSKDGVLTAEPASSRPEAAGQFKYKEGVLTIEPAGKACQIIMKDTKGTFAYAQHDLLYIKRYAVESGTYRWFGCPASVWLSELDCKKVGLMAEMEPTSPLYDLEPGRNCFFQEKWQIIRLETPLENHEQLRRKMLKYVMIN